MEPIHVKSEATDKIIIAKMLDGTYSVALHITDVGILTITNLMNNQVVYSGEFL